jgi:hypothetical protein
MRQSLISSAAFGATIAIAAIAHLRAIAQEAAPPRETGSAAQESLPQEAVDPFNQRGRGGRGRGPRRSSSLEQMLRASAAAENSVQIEAPQPQRGSGTTPPAPPNTNEPTQIIQFHVWVLSIDAPRDKTADQLVAALAETAGDMPQTIGTIPKVRELIGKLSIAGILQRSREFRFSAATGQPAHIESGAQDPMITSTQGNPAITGGRTNSYQFRPVGTVIQATPQLDPAGNIHVNLSYTSSSMQPSMPPVIISEESNGKTLSIPRIVNQSFRSTVRLRSGNAVLVQSDTTTDAVGGAGMRAQLLILGAVVVPENE